MSIGIIDYGAGNLKSLINAFQTLGRATQIIQRTEEFAGVERLILPGVGAFGAALKNLAETGLIPHLTAWVAADRPLLGICLGMQLLFETSAETVGVQGLGVLPGDCTRFEQGKVPLIGWVPVTIHRPDPLFHDIPSESYFYHVHS